GQRAAASDGGQDGVVIRGALVPVPDRAGQVLLRRRPAVVRCPRHPRAQVVERLGDRSEQRVDVLGTVAAQGNRGVLDQLVRPLIFLASHSSAPLPPSAAPSGPPPPAGPGPRRRSPPGPPQHWAAPRAYPRPVS